eukprot:SAG25_NODE_633_length_6301_cov_5.477427_3_plen_132_part_00
MEHPGQQSVQPAKSARPSRWAVCTQGWRPSPSSACLSVASGVPCSLLLCLCLSVCLSVCLSAYLRTDPAPPQPRDHRRSLRVRRGGGGGRRIVRAVWRAGGVVRGAVASEGDCGLGVQWGGVSGVRPDVTA